MESIIASEKAGKNIKFLSAVTPLDMEHFLCIILNKWENYMFINT